MINPERVILVWLLWIYIIAAKEVFREIYILAWIPETRYKKKEWPCQVEFGKGYPGSLSCVIEAPRYSVRAFLRLNHGNFLLLYHHGPLT